MHHAAERHHREVAALREYNEELEQVSNTCRLTQPSQLRVLPCMWVTIKEPQVTLGRYHAAAVPCHQCLTCCLIAHLYAYRRPCGLQS